MGSIVPSVAWTMLSEGEQLRQWRSFLTSLDAGDAGFHRYYAQLMPQWDRGDVPELIVDAHVDALEAEMQSEAAWEATHGFAHHDVNISYGDPPF